MPKEKNSVIPREKRDEIFTFQDAMKIITKELRKDKEYRQSWQSSIAMAFVDCGVDQKVANSGADRFLEWLERE